MVASRGEWVRYSTPGPGGAEYVAICIPAFSLNTVHRDTIKWECAGDLTPLRSQKRLLTRMTRTYADGRV